MGRVKPAAVVLLLFLGGCTLELRDRIESYVQGYEAIRLEKAVYVSPGGDDQNPGTRESPKRSIRAAVGLAAALTAELGALEVRVAGGTYIVDAAVDMREGVSLRGGYAAGDWSLDPDPRVYETIIAAQGEEKVVQVLAGVTPATVIEGFTIRTAWEEVVCGIYCSRGSPTIRNNYIDAGLGVLDSTGIFCISASPRILGNTINAGKGNDACRGIVCQDASAVIRNNVIFQEADGANFRGILCNDSAGVLIQNNTIHGGADGCLIYCAASACAIENNILYASPQAACGIYEADLAALPERVNNNDFYGCDPVYRGADGPTDSTSVADMETYLLAHSVPAKDNQEAIPGFVDAAARDYHLNATSPLRDQGLDLSAFFTDDRDGAPRTVLWSIGAYELD